MKAKYRTDIMFLDGKLTLVLSSFFDGFVLSSSTLALNRNGQSREYPKREGEREVVGEG